MQAASDRLIVALDVDSGTRALELVSRFEGYGVAFKVGSQLFTNSGPELIRTIVERGLRVFLDLKFHDIPNTVAAAAVEAAKLGVWMLNVHALGGREMMLRTADALAGFPIADRPKLIAVTILTSSDTETIREVGIRSDAGDAAVGLVGLAAGCGLDGVVASAMEATRIRKEVNDPKFLIVTPGIRPAAATMNDQKRVMTPAEALAAGSDYLVIGRPIIAADAPEAALEALLDEIKNA